MEVVRPLALPFHLRLLRIIIIALGKLVGEEERAREWVDDSS